MLLNLLCNKVVKKISSAWILFSVKVGCGNFFPMWKVCTNFVFLFFLLCYVKLQIRINYRFRSFGAIILAKIEYRKWTELLKGKQLIPLYLMRLFLYFRIKNQETRTYHELTMLPSSIKNEFITDGTKS